MALYCMHREDVPIFDLAFAKNYLKIDHHDDDELLLQLILSAQRSVEDYADLALSHQRWKYVISTDMTYDYRVAHKMIGDQSWLRFVAPRNPVVRMESIHKVAGVKRVELTDYECIPHQEQTHICIPQATLESAAHLEMIFLAGYADPKAIPVFFIHAVLLTIAHFYKLRDADNTMSHQELTPKVRQMLRHAVVSNRII